MLVAATVIEVNYNCYGDNNESQRGLYMTSILDVSLSIPFFIFCGENLHASLTTNIENMHL